jgi:hypothetical protein
VEASWPGDAPAAVVAVANENNDVQATEAPRIATSPIRTLGDRKIMSLLISCGKRAYEKNLLPIVTVQLTPCDRPDRSRPRRRRDFRARAGHALEG